MSTASPPRLARLVVRLSVPREDRGLVLADLAERFEAIAVERGTADARRWYWSQALRATLARLRPDLDVVSRLTWRGMLGDVRQSLRALRRRPLYTLGVVGTLALGLASAAAVLSVAWYVWLAPLPFPDPDRVVRLYELEPPDPTTSPDAGRTPWRISPPLLADLRATEWTTVDAVSGVSRHNADWLRDGTVSRIQALVVSPELFSILGIAPLVGRPLSSDEDALEVVLTEDFWERVFAKDPSVVGGTALTLNNEPYEIVGVVALPSGYPDRTDVLMRFEFGEEELAADMRGARYLDVVARVDPAYTVAEAAAEMDRIVRSLGERYANHAGWGGDAIRLSDELMRPYRGVLGLLLAAGVAFFLLAVVNVAGLVAARSVEGRSDRSVRLALGASEARLLRAGSVESLLLGALGGAAALGVAYWLLGPIAALVPADVPRIDDVRLGPGIAGTIVVAALLAGWGVGALGYLLSRGASPAVGRSPDGAGHSLVARGALVAGQVALTTLLATAGASVLAEMMSLRAVDIGFDPEGVVASQVLLGGAYPNEEARLVYWRTVLDEARARGLRVGVGTNAPMSGVNMPWGYRPTPGAEQSFAQYHPVGGDYFEVMGIDLLEGRVFDETDGEGSAPVVVINDRLAQEHFPGESPVGRTIVLLQETKTIVGVVRSTRHHGPGADAPFEIYAPLAHDPWPHAQVLLRGEVETASSALSAVLEAVDPGLGVPPPAPYDRYVSEWYGAIRLQVIIVGVMAVVGTLLATLGIYALVAYRVSTRRREIGVRMALGASDGRMFSNVVGQGVRLAAVGIGLGVALWYAVVPLLTGMLGALEARDPRVPLAVAVAVCAVAALASALPAARSVTVDPATTLRAE